MIRHLNQRAAPQVARGLTEPMSGPVNLASLVACSVREVTEQCLSRHRPDMPSRCLGLDALGLTNNVIHRADQIANQPGLTDVGERLGEIGDDVVDVLNADGGADGGIRDAKTFSGLPRYA